VKAERLERNPIITPNMQGRIGANINGPSLIRAPEWLPNPLGRYYLYFAHHKGYYIRLACADSLEGPWRIYEPGVLHVGGSVDVDHVASPDVHVDEERRQIRMYHHLGLTATPRQESRVAVSEDGLGFRSLPERLGLPYFRVFVWGGYYYALGMPGRFYRSRDGLTGFESGPTLFSPNMRHSALKLDGDTLSVFYSDVGDAPERIVLATIRLTPDWMEWTESAPVTVLEPETDYEGADLANEPSVRYWSPVPVRQLRDPAIYREGSETYLLYSVAGESGIAIARLRQTAARV
jgi:hypothetical protein